MKKSDEIKNRIMGKNIQGVWVVYDLEANRKIQNILEQNKFESWFMPSLKIIKRQVKRETAKDISKKVKELLFSEIEDANLILLWGYDPISNKEAKSTDDYVEHFIEKLEKHCGGSDDK